LGGPTRSIKTPASKAIRVIEVRKPPSHEKVTAHGEYVRLKRGCLHSYCNFTSIFVTLLESWKYYQYRKFALFTCT